MVMTLNQSVTQDYLHLKVSGKLAKEDYEKIVPQIDRMIEDHDKLKLLIEIDDFHGWYIGGLWEDLKFDAKHYRDIEQIAVVGEKKWEKNLTTLFKPFTRAKVRYFERDQKDEALTWLSVKADSAQSSESCCDS